MEHSLALLKTHRVLAVIRTQSVELGLGMARAAAAGGIRLIEVTWNSHRPAALVETLRIELPHCHIGCGTLLTQQHLTEAITAGAEYGFMPHVDAHLIRYGLDHHFPLYPGALTPTEIVTAWQSGAVGVKVFPVAMLGGCDYIRSLQGPLGHIPLIPTGGVTRHNAKDFLRAGAVAVGISGDLFPAKAVAEQNWADIKERSRQILQSLSSEEKRMMPKRVGHPNL